MLPPWSGAEEMLFVQGGCAWSGLGIRRERERAALRVTADGPALTRVDH
jgi:hypothetical protein